MTYEPLVSVITPCYNHEKFIAQCIESVLSQTYENWEMVIVDDNSSDRSVDIVKLYANRDPRIRVIHHKINYGAEGLASTYNEALHASSGQLIAILEGDDFWTPNKLQAQVPAFKDQDVVLVYSDFDEIADSGHLIKRHRNQVDPRSFKSSPTQNLRFFSHLRYFAPNTVVIRKSSLLKSGGFLSTNIPVVDFPTFLKLAFEGCFLRVPLNLGFYRRHADSVAFGNARVIARGSVEFLKALLEQRRTQVEQYGLNFEELYENTERALGRQEDSVLYFEGKYHLIFGNNVAARKNFARALLASKISLRHRALAFIGLLASLTSRKIFLALLRLRGLRLRRNMD